jgi:hypothetical protein
VGLLPTVGAVDDVALDVGPVTAAPPNGADNVMAPIASNATSCARDIIGISRNAPPPPAGLGKPPAVAVARDPVVPLAPAAAKPMRKMLPSAKSLIDVKLAGQARTVTPMNVVPTFVDDACA